MDRAKIRKVFLRIAEQVTESKIGDIDDSEVVGALGIDSVLFMEIVGAVETRFQINIPDPALTEVSTIGDFLQVLETAITRKSNGTSQRIGCDSARA
jgi:hybrid polyketide synthase/nonribosomal peptide synthetase FtdB